MKTPSSKKLYLFLIPALLISFLSSCEKEENIIKEEKSTEIFIYKGEELPITTIKQGTNIRPVEDYAYNKVSDILANPNSGILKKDDKIYLFDTEEEYNDYINSSRNLNENIEPDNLKHVGPNLEVHFYVHANFDTEIPVISGTYTSSPRTYYWFSNLQNSGYNDQISSIKVYHDHYYDWDVICYEHANFVGHWLAIYATAGNVESGYTNLQNDLMYWKNIFKRIWWNDQISSIKIERS